MREERGRRAVGAGGSGGGGAREATDAASSSTAQGPQVERMASPKAELKRPPDDYLEPKPKPEPGKRIRMPLCDDDF